jgi:hypothetical protein
MTGMDLPGSSGMVLRGVPLAVLAGDIPDVKAFQTARKAAGYVWTAFGVTGEWADPDSVTQERLKGELRELLHDVLGFDSPRLNAGRAALAALDGA